MADPSNDDKFDKGREKQVIGGSQPIGANDGGSGSGMPLTQGAELGGPAATSQTEGEGFILQDEDETGGEG